MGKVEITLLRIIDAKGYQNPKIMQLIKTLTKKRGLNLEIVKALERQRML